MTSPIITPEISESRKNHYKRLGRYAESKKRTRALAKFIFQEHQDLKKVAESLNDCGNFLTYRHYYESDEFRLIRGNSCDKHLLCGICAARRGARQFYHYREAYLKIIAKDPDKRIVFFTMTVKNGPILSERYQHLYASMATLLHKRRNAKAGKTKTVMAEMSGAVWSYEVTNRGKGWHPHIHGIGLVSSGADPRRIERQLKKEWEEITGDSHQVKVEFPRTKDNELKAFFEVFKYSLKFGELSFKNQVEVYKTLAGRRLMASNGDFFGVKIDETEDSAEIEKDFYDIMYKYDKKTSSYRKYFIEHHATSIDSSRPKAHYREKDILKITESNGDSEWLKPMRKYCEQNGLSSPTLKTPSWITRSKSSRTESANTVEEQKVSGGTTGYQLPLITVDRQNVAK